MPADASTQGPSTRVGLAPVVDARTRIVVLGSFPGEASLAAQQYYAHPKNALWRVLSDITGVLFIDLPYEQRLHALLDCGIGLWDVVADCERIGSLDSSIRNLQANDFSRLMRLAPVLQRVCHNGKLSARFAPALAALGLETRVLPSTSPAYAAMRYEAKLALWRDALTLGR